MKSASLAVLGVFSAALAGVLDVFALEPAWIDITHLPLALPRLDPAFDGFRLVQISDIHMGGWMNRARLDRVVAKVLDLKPDAVAITGDFLVGHTWTTFHDSYITDLADSLQQLSTACPTVAVLGNHDYWTKPAVIRKMLQSAGIVELPNTFLSIERDQACLHLAGVDDVWEGMDRLDHVLSRLPAEDCAILLAHEPDFADQSAASGRFDLQISGHSHGGQIVLPLIGAPVLPFLGEKYYSGLYTVGKMFQYTNRGVGMARLPVRFNCHPEITLLELKSNA